MKSIEGELVPFIRPIDPVASKGQVEDWLLQVEDVMIKSVKDVVEKSHNDYAKKPRDKWVILWQGQAVLATSSMYWTLNTEDAMNQKGLPGLVAYHEKLH